MYLCRVRKASRKNRWMKHSVGRLIALDTSRTLRLGQEKPMFEKSLTLTGCPNLRIKISMKMMKVSHLSSTARLLVESSMPSWISVSLSKLFNPKLNISQRVRKRSSEYGLVG